MKSLPVASNPAHDHQPRNGLRRLLWRLDWSSILTGLGLWLIFVALFATIQFASLKLASNDDYFHIRFAQVMREESLRPTFPWLPLTILNAEDYYDHHFLYHVLLIPFTFGDLRQGAKMAGVIFPALAFVMGWVVLRGQRVPYAALWALGFLAVSEAFLERLIMTRVQAVSLLMLLLMLHLTLKKRYRWLLPLAFVYTWLYDAFPLLLAMIGIYVAACWLFDRQLTLTPLLYTIAGIGLGLLINPYFPNNLFFIYHHYLPKLMDITGADIRVGGEWYPYRTWSLVENSGLAVLALVAGTFGLAFRQDRLKDPIGFLYILALFFGLLLFKSRRFVEYFPAFAWLFGVIAWQPFLMKWRQGRRSLAIILPLVLVLLLSPVIWMNVQAAREDLEDSQAYERYGQASAWLKANSLPGSRVFQTDWDDFTQLYYYNTQNVYTIGLDPTYMHSYDPELYQLWRDISRGQTQDMAQVIRQSFGADYVISDLGHYSFIDKAARDPYLKEVYRDEYAVIFRVLYGEG